MADLSLPELLGGIISDGLGELRVPGGTVFGEVIKSYLSRRAEAARDVLFDELRRGKVLPERISVDDAVIGVIHRYLRAAQEGSARINLRLLAKAIAGRLQTGKLIADEFFRYADILAGLSREEIVFLAAMYRTRPVDAKGLTSVTTDEWAAVLDAMKVAGWDGGAVYAIASRCLRTGFVVAIPAVGTLNFAASPLLIDLAKTVDLNDALMQEQAA